MTAGLRLPCFDSVKFSTTIPRMLSRRRGFTIFQAALIVSTFALETRAQQPAPAASGARILLLPRRIVSGERATLAVLDVNRRVTPDVQVNFSNGDPGTHDTTRRETFTDQLY